MKTIYIRTNLINGKQYIGQTSDFKRRERDWRKVGSEYANKELDEDRTKYSLENWKVEVLEDVEDLIADKKEREYIALFNTLCPNGYNHYNGGIRGFTFEMNEDTKRKISKTLKGVPKKWKEGGKEKIAETTRERLSKQVDQIDITTGEILHQWESAKEAARQLGYSQGNISNCCKGGFFSKSRNKWTNKIQSYGYIWKCPL